jgi:hypothetical protein
MGDDEDRSHRHEEAATVPYCGKSDWLWREYGQDGGDVQEHLFPSHQNYQKKVAITVEWEIMNSSDLD